MKRGNLVIAAFSLVIVLSVTYWEFGKLTSPGPLHPSHRDVSELHGRFSCAACHGEERVSMADACLQCHAAIASQMTGTHGLHGGLPVDTARSCQLCHAEHNGGELALVTDAAFKIAGTKDPEHYDHRDIEGFALEGSHTALRCEQCHANARAVAIPAGERRFLGLTQDCLACHDDPHIGSFGPDCASCHGQSNPFAQVAAFTHTERFALAGGHGGLSCKSCHEDGTAYAIADLQKQAPEKTRGCVDCHRTPHRRPLLEAVATERSTTLRGTCAECHDPMHDSFLYPKAKLSVWFHAATGFALKPPHDVQTCGQCHEAMGQREPLIAGPDFLKRYGVLFPLRSPDNCAACHEDPHKGQFGGGPTGRRCIECHKPTGFTPNTFGIEQHAGTAFPLTGAHERADCAKCHEVVDGVKRFVGVSKACVDCHEDPHGGQFDVGPTAGRCDACHDTLRFQPTGFDQARHAKTRFPLNGAHQAVGCRDCHEERDDVRRFVTTPMDCADCHEDVHSGIFDGVGKPVMVDGRRGCARCHIADGFDRVRWTGDIHGRWTGYPLVGAHAEADCTDCHKPVRRSDGRNLTFAKVTHDCASCHADPHAGQFKIDQVTDCARCHSETQTFKQTVFDHQTQSRFKLDETHIALECGACHKAYPLSGGGELIRYIPLGVRCEDCHGFSSYSERGARK